MGSLFNGYELEALKLNQTVLLRWFVLLLSIK